MKKKVMLYLFEDEYRWLKDKSEEDRMSMNYIIQDWIRDKMKKLEKEDKPYPNKIIEVDDVKTYNTKEEVIKKVKELKDHSNQIFNKYNNTWINKNV